MAKKTAKKAAKPKAAKTPTEYMVVKSADTKAMTNAYNNGYRRVGTYQGGAVAVLRNPAHMVGTSN